MKAWQGPGRKGRLRRKHRRDIAFHNLSLLAFRKEQRGPEKIDSEEKRTPPPQLRRDMRLGIASNPTKAGFPSGPLESPNLLPVPALWLSTNLEKNLKL